MTKTLSLRRLIQTQLNTVQGATYHRTAPSNASYPYKVFSLGTASLLDLHRDDIDLCVDIWDRGSAQRIENIADSIDALFNDVNLPQADILPTFYRNTRYPVNDVDKELYHIQMHFTVQLYTMED